MHSNARAFASIISVLLFAISCSKSNLATAQISTTDQEFLTAHNSARAAVGVGPVSWDATIAAYAENHANHSLSDWHDWQFGSLSRDVPGENIFCGSGLDFTPTFAVNIWVSEKQYYDYDTNTCAGLMCSHYTQVVWEATARIGCGRAKCHSGRAKCDGGSVCMICSYSPAGNAMGQRPYRVPGVVFTNWGRIEARVVMESSIIAG